MSVSTDWVMTVTVRLRNAMEQDAKNAKEVLLRAIQDEGGAHAVIQGWCDADDVEIVSLEPAVGDS